MKRIALLVTITIAMLVTWSCSHEIEGPGSPKVTQQNLTYCGADFQSFAIEGSGLSPMVIDGAQDEPRLDMPNVCLTRIADSSGNPVSGEPTICLDDRDVQWVSQNELRFTVRASLGLTPGRYDVTVTNPDGTKAQGSATLEVRSDGPIIFFADPSVVYNGISTQVTIFGANLGVIDQVVMKVSDSPEAPEIELQFVLVQNNLENRIQAIIPQGTGPGLYDIIARKIGGCETTLFNGVTVTDTVDLTLKTIDPSFGWADAPTPVTITGAEFAQVPRAYLNPVNPAPETVASPIDSVAFVSPDRITGVVPQGLPLGNYDLIVVNPDGRVGLLQSAFLVTAAAPPVVTNVSPSYLPTPGTTTATIDGENFNAPTVTMYCRPQTGTTACTTDAECGTAPFTTCYREGCSATVTPAVDGATVTATSFDAAIDTSSLPAGTVCVLRVTNGDGAYYDYSAIGISNSSLNLSPFVAGSSLITARRAPAVAAGRATNAARFIYAIGGDGGDPGSALASVETVPIDIFGVPGEWYEQQVSLPEARTLSSVIRVGQFLYLAGGSVGGAASNSVVRAQVLSPLDAPKIVDVTVRKGCPVGERYAPDDPNKRPNSDCVVDAAVTTAEGIGAGVWYYRVSALMADNDPSNPGGETLPSDALVINLSAKGVEGTLVMTLIWDPVPGAKGYRIYRSPTGDLPVGSEQLFAEVMDPAATTYEDAAPVGPPNGAPPIGKPPLPLGSTGVWMALPTLGTARQANGIAAGPDPGNANLWHIYVLGGSDGAAALDSVERIGATINADRTHSLEAGWTAMDPLSVARSELSGYSVGHAEAVQVPVGTTYIYAGGGKGSNNIDASQIGAGGALTWSTPSTMGPNQAGYGGVAGAEWLFAFGGQQSGPSDKVDSGRIQTPPALDNWQPQGGTQLVTPRYLSGGAVESAFIFVVGGQSDGGPTATTERTVL